ncbi:MAG: hypothetical protein RLZZ396_2692, partial [Planctomycetota bacterium]
SIGPIRIEVATDGKSRQKDQQG